MKRLGLVFIAGTVVTLLVAWYLWEQGHKVAAAAVIVASPFPCPPPLPC